MHLLTMRVDNLNACTWYPWSFIKERQLYSADLWQGTLIYPMQLMEMLVRTYNSENALFSKTTKTR